MYSINYTSIAKTTCNLTQPTFKKIISKIFVDVFSFDYLLPTKFATRVSFSCACKVFEMKSLHIRSIKYRLITELVYKLQNEFIKTN